MKLLAYFLLCVIAAPSVFCSLAQLQDLVQLSSSDSAEGKCDVKRVGYCFDGYAHQLGLDKMPKEFQKYSNQLLHIYETEKERGFIKVCRAYYHLRFCAGRSLYPCMTVDSLTKNFNLTKNNAAAYSVHALEQKFNCGPGFRPFLKSFGCMMKHAAEANKTLQGCTQAYIKNVTKEPKKVCEFGQDFADCYSNYQTKTCGKDAGWVVCENFEIAFRHSDAHCHLKCPHRDVSSAELVDQFPLPDAANEHHMCDKEKYVKCGLAYADDLGYNFTKDPMAFLGFLKSVYAKEGAKGFLRVCDAGYTWHECLGWRDYFSCVNIVSLVEMGLTVPNATIYITLADQLAFQCGPILPLIVKNFPCAMDVMKRGNQTLQGCEETFIKNLQKDPQQRCMHTEEYMMCYSSPFGQACGKGAGFAICSSIQAGFRRTMPDCSLHCVVGEGMNLEEDEVEPSFNLLMSVPIPGEEASQAENPIEAGVKMPAAVEAGVAIHKETTCDQTKFKTCLDSYAKDIGMKAFPTSPQEFSTYVSSHIKDKAHFASFCNATKKFGECLGTEETACLSIENLMHMGQSKQQALAWMTMAALLKDECGRDFKVLYDNFDCITKTGTKYNKTILHCAEDFERFVKHDPKRICHFTVEYVHCVSKPYKDNCNMAVGKAVCAAARAAMKVPIPQCRRIPCYEHEMEHFLLLPQMPETQEFGVELSNSVEKTVCDDIKFRTCVGSYSRALGLPSVPSVHEFIRFIATYLVSKDHFASFCQASQGLDRCLGEKTLDTCFSVKYLMHHGVRKQDAITLEAFKDEMVYACGEGYKVFHDNFDCYLNTTRTHVEELIKCTEKLEEEIHKEPKKLCQFYNEYFGCMEKPVDGACGKDAGHVFCEANVRAMSTLLSECKGKLSCPKV